MKSSLGTRLSPGVDGWVSYETSRTCAPVMSIACCKLGPPALLHQVFECTGSTCRFGSGRPLKVICEVKDLVDRAANGHGGLSWR